MKIRKISVLYLLFVGIICAGLIVGQTGVLNAETMKIANTHHKEYSLSQAAAFFAQRVEKHTDGKYNFDLYYSGALGTQTEALEQAQMGAIEIVPSSPGFLNEFASIADLFNVPYLFKSEKHMWKVLEDEEIMGEVHDKIEDAGFKVLSWMPAGARSVYNKKRPIEKPEDLEGLKIRVMGSDVMIQAFEALGASPTVTAFEEVYSALQTGVIDGAENNATSVVSMSHNEVSEYYSLTEHMMIPDLLVMSLEVYENMPESDQEAFMKAAEEARFYMRGQWDRTTMNAMEFLREDMQVNEIENKTPFIEAVSDLHEELDPKFGGLIEKIQNVEVNY